MKVFAAMYNPCTWLDGSSTVLSIHKDREGALSSIQIHRSKRELDFDSKAPIKGMTVHNFESWDVKEFEVKGDDLLLELLNQAFIHKIDGLVTITVTEKKYNEVSEKHRLFNQ